MITVDVTINAPIEKVWKLWTTHADIMQWNVPFDHWHSPRVENDLKDEGKFLFRMEAKDGSVGFDFCGKYDKVITNELITYTLDDGRKTTIVFTNKGNSTTITESFDPENKIPLDEQKAFCKAVLNKFKRYVEEKN